MAPFIIFILGRLLFIASMVFIIGNLFGGFSKRKTLKTLGRIGSIFIIIFFIAGSFLHRPGPRGWHSRRLDRGCWTYQKDSTNHQTPRHHE